MISTEQYSLILNMLLKDILKKHESIIISDHLSLKKLETIVYAEVPEEMNVYYSYDSSEHQFVFGSAENKTEKDIEIYLQNMMNKVII